jgi:long-chain acyl-CoA synthetase
MEIDLELYRQEIRVSDDPLIRLSAIDIHPPMAQHTLVFLHGYGGRAQHWIYQLREFSMSHRVIALEMRGHGLSDKPLSAYTMDELQGDLLDALDVLGVKQPIVLVGHSFGGAVAAQFAHDHPERVQRLITIATTGEFRLNPLYRFLLTFPYSVHRLIAPFVRQWLGAPPVIMKRLHDNTLRTWNGWSLFRDIQVPTLVIRGDRDRVFESGHFEEVARAVPGASDLNVGASGHMVMLERREAVNRAIKGFIEGETGSWRSAQAQQQREPRMHLLGERPWLAHYDARVPYTISIPDIPLPRLLRSAVRRFPLRWALNFEGYRLTYRRLNHEVNRFANALLAMGLHKGDRVMVLLPNLPQFVISFYGTLKAGGVAVFTLPLNSPNELLRQIKDSGARALVTSNHFADLAQTALAESKLEHVLLTQVSDYLPSPKRLGVRFSKERDLLLGPTVKLRPGMRPFLKALYSHSRKSPDIQVKPEDSAVIIYTGGTTDQPKGVLLSHRNLVANALQTRHWMPEAQEGKERFLCAIPFAHAYGLTAALNVGIAVGATLTLKARFETLDILQTIKQQRPTIFPGVPNFYVAISNYRGVRKFNIASIRACISGSAPLPVEVQESFEKLTRGRLVEGYGLTEAGPVTHANPLQGLRKLGSIGIPIPSTEARLVSLTDANQEVEAGHLGELAVRGPQVMHGYWQDEAATRQAITKDGWLLTGDVAQADEQGYFRIVARKADMWYPAKPGDPAFPRDVEEVLYEVPQVKEATVVAIAGKPIAFIIPNGERPSKEMLQEYCKRRLPPELVPRVFLFVDDFPRSFIGKVLRRELIATYDDYEPA